MRCLASDPGHRSAAASERRTMQLTPSITLDVTRAWQHCLDTSSRKWTLWVSNKTQDDKFASKPKLFASQLQPPLCIRVVPFIEITACSEATTGNNYAITKDLKDSNYEWILSSVYPDRIRSCPLLHAINISGFHIRGRAGAASLITSARKRITSFWHFWREFRMPTFILCAVNILCDASDLFYLYLKLNILSRQRARARSPSSKER